MDVPDLPLALTIAGAYLPKHLVEDAASEGLLAVVKQPRYPKSLVMRSAVFNFYHREIRDKYGKSRTMEPLDLHRSEHKVQGIPMFTQPRSPYPPDPWVLRIAEELYPGILDYYYAEDDPTPAQADLHRHHIFRLRQRLSGHLKDRRKRVKLKP